jgi:CrcB protein
VLVRLLLVGAGGFAGAVLRFLVGVLALRTLPVGFPYATFFVNVTGCFAIGLLAAAFDQRDAGIGTRLFWLTGVLGGYTTFSAFGHETVTLLRDGGPGAALANVAGQVIVGLAAVWAGAALVRAWS